jgi:predicted exporter
VRLLWLAALLLSMVQLARTPLNLDLSGFLPSHAHPTQRLLIDQMRDGVGGRLILLAITGDTPEQRARISQQLAERMQRSGQFSLVANGTPLPPAQLEWLMERRYLLTPNLGIESFNAANLRRTLEESLRLLASPLSGVIQTWLPRDPGGAMLALLQSLAGQNPPSIQHGVWFSHDGQRALLLAYSHAPGMDARAQERALASIQDAFSSIRVTDGSVSNAQLQLSGAPVFAADARQQIEHAAQRITVLSVLLVTLILWLAYRAWKPVVYSLIPLLAGLLVGAAVVGAWFGSIHGITLAFGAILIGEAVDYPAYLFTHRAPGEALATTAWRIRHALRLAMLTTALGALFMLLSDLEGLRQLGLLTAVGTVAAGLTTRWLLPALQPGEYRLPRLPAWPRPPRWLAILLLVGAAIVLIRAGLVWDDDLANLSPTPPEALAQDRALRSELGAPDARFLLTFTAPTAEAALALSEQHQPWLESLVRDGIITGYALAAQSLPSQAAQQARRAALPDGATASRNLQQALQGLPFRPGSFAPFLQDIERARSLLLIQRRDLDGSPWAARVDALLTQGQGRWIALAPLSGISQAARLTAAVNQHGAPGVALLDIKGDTETLLRNARKQALHLMLAGIATIGLLLGVSLGSAGAAARTLLPVLAAMLTTTGTLLALGIQLNLFHLISLLLVLGIGLNYALFFQRRAENPESAQRAGLAVGLCGMTSLAAFACLTFTPIPVLHAIGLTVLLGTLYSLFYAAAWRPNSAMPDPG